MRVRDRATLGSTGRTVVCPSINGFVAVITWMDVQRAEEIGFAEMHSISSKQLLEAPGKTATTFISFRCARGLLSNEQCGCSQLFVIVYGLFRASHTNIRDVPVKSKSSRSTFISRCTRGFLLLRYPTCADGVHPLLFACRVKKARPRKARPSAQ